MSSRLAEVADLVRAESGIRDSSPPHGEASLDLIACRNVLTYFRPEAIERAEHRLAENPLDAVADSGRTALEEVR